MGMRRWQDRLIRRLIRFRLRREVQGRDQSDEGGRTEASGAAEVLD